MSRNLDKTQMYESVKAIVDCPEDHIHLPQHKLFTLFSIAFNYMLYSAGKASGSYIIRVEDRQLADKLARKAKDSNTRRFFERLIIPAKMTYAKSTFHLDYFQSTTWKKVNDIDPSKIKMAIIVKNTSSRPMDEVDIDPADEEYAKTMEFERKNIDEKIYYHSLREKADRTIAIGYEAQFPGATTISFPFIKKDENRALGGVKLSSDFDYKE